MILDASLLAFSVAAFAWAWIGYPLFLRMRIRRWSLVTIARDHQPAVSIIIPAFNQQAVILRKIRDTLALDYPRHLMEILVVSDGSSDHTDELVKRVKDPRVRLVALPRTGRISALHQAAARGHGEVLVFTDPAVRVQRDALRKLMRNFADHHVGGAAASVHIRRRRDGDSLGIGEAVFARYDAWVRRLESALGSVHSADRSFWAIRRTLLSTPRNLAQSDDMAFSTRVVLGSKRFVFDPAAKCRRDAPADGVREMRRRAHVTNYTLRSISDVKWQLFGRRGFAFQLLSHTVSRFMSPIHLLTMLVTTAILASVHSAFVWALGVQLGFIALSVIGWKLRGSRIGRLALFALPAWFAAYNIASFLGIYAFVVRRQPMGATPRKVAPLERRPEPKPEFDPDTFVSERLRGLPFDTRPRSTSAPPVSAIV